MIESAPAERLGAPLGGAPSCCEKNSIFAHRATPVCGAALRGAPNEPLRRGSGHAHWASRP
eukprot:1931611-Alexandrium_andersonii.AAC.1